MAEETVDGLPIQNGQLKQLYRYCLEMRGARQMPPRSAFDPTTVPRLLPNLILLDIHPDTGRLLVRLLGTRVATIYGADYTGRHLDEIDFGSGTDRVLEDYGTCAREGRPVLGQRDFHNVRNVAYRMERLILPFSNDGQVPDKLLSCLHFIELS
ncbi:MAG: PAS domain-containing protein [Minwuia sp.]|nr:PAS domain-containing protein [Minwuia sp.]